MATPKGYIDRRFENRPELVLRLNYSISCPNTDYLGEQCNFGQSISGARQVGPDLRAGSAVWTFAGGSQHCDIGNILLQAAAV